MIRYLKYYLPGPKKAPIYLIHFVTSKCTGKCLHCFYWREINRPENPLSPSEIGRIASGMGPLLQLLLTGGEPYLREDFDDVVRAYYEVRPPFNIAIATSGYFPDRTLRSAQALIEDCPQSNFIFGISIEGIGEENDRIRGVDGFFDRSTATVRALNELKQSLPRSRKNKLTVLVDITLSSLNQETVEETYDYLRDELKPDVVNVILLRGEVRNPEKAAGPDVEIYRSINRRLDDDLRKGVWRGYGGFTRLVNAKDAVLRRVTAGAYEEKGRYYPCAAGRLVGVLMPEGEVRACELLPDTFGNLRDADYDIVKLWTSQAAREFRERILAQRCRCPHQCFLSTTIFFNPVGLAEVGFEFLQSAFR